MIVCITGGPGTGKTFLGRALALELHAHLLSTDDVIILRGRRAESGEESKGQHSMMLGIETVLDEILPELRLRGGVIEERGERPAARAPDLLARRAWKVMA